MAFLLSPVGSSQEQSVLKRTVNITTGTWRWLESDKKPVKFLRELYSQRIHRSGLKTFMMSEDLKPPLDLHSSSGKKQAEKALWLPRRLVLQYWLHMLPQKLKLKENLPEDGPKWSGEQKNPNPIKEQSPLPGRGLALYVREQNSELSWTRGWPTIFEVILSFSWHYFGCCM